MHAWDSASFSGGGGAGAPGGRGHGDGGQHNAHHDEDGIFSISKVEYSPPRSIVDLVTSNNILVMALEHSHIIRLDLSDAAELEGSSRFLSQMCTTSVAASLQKSHLNLSDYYFALFDSFAVSVYGALSFCAAQSTLSSSVSFPRSSLNRSPLNFISTPVLPLLHSVFGSSAPYVFPRIFCVV